VDELIGEAFTYNGWATTRLLAFCRELTPDQLNQPGAGTYGSILATLNHLIRSDAGYLPRAKITRPTWVDSDDEDRDAINEFNLLEARVKETAALWQKYLADPLDVRQLLLLDEGAYECQSSVPVIQALHHGNAHREQISSLITNLGLEPPDISVWAFGEDTGRSRELPEQARSSPAGRDG